jgi:outer membrane protein assembly factor BamB
VDGDLVYVGSYTSNGGRVYALSITDGQIIWEYPKGGAYIGAIVGSPVIANEIIYVGSSDSAVYALDTNRNGVEEWKAEILDEKGKKHEKLWTSPVIQGNTLYVSTFDGHIYALSVETGELLDWSFKSEAGFASSPVIYEDTIFLGSFDRYLYAVKIGSDVPMWKFPEEKPAGNWFWASPIINEGIVYAGCLDGKLYAIEAKTGEKLWEFDAGNPIVTSPVLMDNLLIVTDESGTVYVFDLGAELGGEAALLKTMSIGADVRSSFCAQDGLVYIRGEDNQLYVVDINVGGVWKLNLTIEE